MLKLNPKLSAEQRREVLQIIKEAAGDWNSGCAYIDGRGNYRLRTAMWRGKWVGKGAVAPWNLIVKRCFADSSEFHKYALLYVI